MWFGVGLVPPRPSLSQTNDCVSTLSEMAQLGHQSDGASGRIHDIYLGKAPPAFYSPLPATVANPVPSLSNTDLTVCKAVLETEAKSLK